MLLEVADAGLQAVKPVYLVSLVILSAITCWNCGRSAAPHRLAGSQTLIPSPGFTGLFALRSEVGAMVYNDYAVNQNRVA